MVQVRSWFPRFCLSASGIQTTKPAVPPTGTDYFATDAFQLIERKALSLSQLQPRSPYPIQPRRKCWENPFHSTGWYAHIATHSNIASSSSPSPSPSSCSSFLGILFHLDFTFSQIQIPLLVGWYSSITHSRIALSLTNTTKMQHSTFRNSHYSDLPNGICSSKSH